MSPYTVPPSLTDCSVYVTLAGMTTVPRTADVVVVGGGTIGAWAAWFLKESGAGEVVLVERETLGQGASARAAGMVRAQGGTEAAVRLGMFSRDFYAGQQERLGIDSGFVAQGYFMPCFSEAEVAQAGARIAMQQGVGLDVRWVSRDEVDAMNPAMAPGRTLGASYAAEDGYLDPPRNVLAYTAALFTAGVRVLRADGVHRSRRGGRARDRVPHLGGRHRRAAGRAHRRTDPGRRGRGGRRADPAGAARHQVVVTEAHPDFAAERLPMVFDVASGIYWRPCEGGVLWGMSNPEEAPGEAMEFDAATTT